MSKRHSRELIDQIVLRLEEKIEAVDKRHSQRFEDNGKAVDAALAAAKEANLKAENASSGITAAINDRLSRVTSNSDQREGRGRGISDGWGWIVGAAAMIFAAISLFHSFIK